MKDFEAYYVCCQLNSNLEDKGAILLNLFPAD